MELYTKRLLLRSLRPEDWRQVQCLFQDFSDSNLAIYDAPLPCDDAGSEALTRVFAESGLFFSVFEKGSDTMAGYVCFHREESVYDLGYLFHRDFQGKGYALEACNELLDYMEQQSICHFSAHTAMENVASFRLLNRLGFELRSIRPHAFHADENGEPILFHSGKFLLEL